MPDHECDDNGVLCRACDRDLIERHARFTAECWCGWWRQAPTKDEAEVLADLHKIEYRHFSQTGVVTW